MTVLMTFEITTDGVPRIGKRRWNQIVRATYRTLAEYWMKALRPKHFTPGGAAEYGYARRDPRYLRTKKRKQGHRRPLEYKGHLRRETARSRIVATSKRATVFIRGRVLNLKGRIDMAKEMSTVSLRERVQFDRIATRKIESELRRRRSRQTVTIS